VDVRSDTRSRFGAVPIKDKDGRSLLVVISKYTFSVDPFGKVELDPDKGVDPYLVDEPNGADPGTSSIRKPSDLADEVPGTQVLLVGHAHPPLRGSATHVDVSLRVGPIAKTVRAHGLRVWQKSSLAGVAPGPALPLREPVPLIYELAWGGMDRSDPEHPLGEPRNYVGRGVTRSPRSLLDQPAAQLEDPARPLDGRDPAPACFGAIHRHWQPRLSFAGTYDQRWQETKMPLLPDDFDPRFNVCVPADQWSLTPLRGDEPIEVLGATPEGAWRFALPRLSPGFSSWVDGQRRDHRTHLDTLLIDADAMRVEVTFHAAIPLPRKMEMLERVMLLEKSVLRSVDGPDAPARPPHRSPS
jgi:hypothetical protein